jgi:putative endopeptidase
MKATRQRLFAIVLAIVFTLPVFEPALAQHATPVASPVSSSTHGIQLADMDLSVDPGQDFYRFANGGWLDRTVLPPDHPSIGTFDQLSDETTQVQLQILSSLAAGKVDASTDEGKVVKIFAQGTDVKTRDAQGLTPIAPDMKAIDAITDLASLHAYFVSQGLEGSPGFFSVYVSPDLANSSVYSVYLSGPPLGLPNRDYYLVDNSDNEAVRAAYIADSAQMLEMAGEDKATAEADAKADYQLEHDLAAPTLTREDQQDFSKIYNPTTLADLAKTYPALDWSAYLASMGIPKVDTVVVTDAGYLKALNAIVQKTPIATIKTMLKLQLLWAAAPYLSTAIYAPYFDFFGKTINGQTTTRPNDEKVLSRINGVMGQAVGKLYVAQTFPPQAKDQITQLVKNIIAAYRQRLVDNPWMTPVARQAALNKLDRMGLKVGYPDHWLSYAAVQVGDSYARSIDNAAVVEAKRENARAGQPVDRSEWGLNPQDVNAYYDPQNNEIVFPAAILQAPFFDYQADPASNYGGIGYVIGHEITHGFDITGSQFDASGNLKSWWTQSDTDAFNALEKKLVDQYDAIEIQPGLHLEGQIELGENTADLGGIQNAYAALQTALKQQGDPGKIDGFTQDQRFFIAAAQVWREKVQPAALTSQVKTDEHAPGSVRGTQPLRNDNDFYTAFDIQPGDKMYLPPDQRIVIW